MSEPSPGERPSSPILLVLAGAFAGILSFMVAIPAASMKNGASGFAVHEDQLNLVANLRYFVWDEWRWPLTKAAGLGGPPGSVTALNDGIPAYAIALRLLRRSITPDFDFIGIWLLLCYAAQGAAAAWAARMWGVRRPIPTISASILAVSVVAWIAQWIHAALCLQAVILVAVGLVGAAGRIRPARLLAAWVLLGAFAVAVNAYLFGMTAALALASLVSLRRRGWSPARIAGAVGVLLGSSLVAMAAFGLLSRHPPGQGYGFFSMNLLSPLDPPARSLFGREGHPIDATGGQYEGLNYLGPGLLAALLAAIWVRRRELSSLARRHAEILAAAAALAAFAISHRVLLGRRLILLLPPPPALLSEFRASGRFFWPVTYLALVGAVATLARRGRRWDGFLLAAALVQWTDAAGERMRVRSALESPPTPLVDAVRWEPLIAAHRRVLFVPSWDCASGRERRFIEEAIVAASATRTEVSSFHNGRPAAVDCAGELAALRAGEEPDPETLIVDVGGAPAPPLSGRWRCSTLPDGRVCSAEPKAWPSLKSVRAVADPIGRTTGR